MTIKQTFNVSLIMSVIPKTELEFDFVVGYIFFLIVKNPKCNNSGNIYSSCTSGSWGFAGDAKIINSFSCKTRFKIVLLLFLSAFMETLIR